MKRAIAALAVLASACQSPRDVTVDHAWVRLPAVAGNPGAAYFTLHGGVKDETLTAVAAPAAIRAEMHDSMTMGGRSTSSGRGMTTMTPLKLVAIRAGTTLNFAPGGRHVMLFGLGPQVKAGGTLSLQYIFASGRTVAVEAKVAGAGDDAPR